MRRRHALRHPDDRRRLARRLRIPAAAQSARGPERLALRLIGYPLDDRAAALRAFHRHFRGMETDALDAEDLRILYALTSDTTPIPGR